MNNSNIFDVPCEKIPLETFMMQFCFQINLIVPPEIVEKYFKRPPGVLLPLSYFTERMLNCYTVKEMHDVFMDLTETEKANIVWSLITFTTEAQAYPMDAMVYVPEDPKNYIKPYFAEMLTFSNILI